MKLPKFARPSLSTRPAPSQANHYLCFKSSRAKQDLRFNASNSSPVSTSCTPVDAVTTSVVVPNVVGDSASTSCTPVDAVTTSVVAPNVVGDSASLWRSPSNMMQEMKQVFAQFDANHDGKISIDELCTVLQSLGVETAREDAKLMIEEADANGDGFIDLQEFMELHRDHMQVMAQDELTATFEMFDLNKDGHITAHELHTVLTNLGDDGHTSLEDCNRMIGRVDRKGVGHVDLDDFKLMMMHA